MDKEIKKINRDICLIKYRKIPLIAYDQKTDSEVFYFPKYKAHYWIKLPKVTSKKLTSELIKLLNLLNFKKFIFLDAKNKPWISKETEKRKDHKPLVKTVEYLKSLKIDTKFNGGIEIEVEKLQEFIPHFFRITSCDSGFFDYHFTDIDQNVIFYIHYSGEIQILPLNNKINNKIRKIIKKTNFIDTLSERANRI